MEEGGHNQFATATGERPRNSTGRLTNQSDRLWAKVPARLDGSPKSRRFVDRAPAAACHCARNDLSRCERPRTRYDSRYTAGLVARRCVGIDARTGARFPVAGTFDDRQRKVAGGISRPTLRPSRFRRTHSLSRLFGRACTIAPRSGWWSRASGAVYFQSFASLERSRCRVEGAISTIARRVGKEMALSTGSSQRASKLQAVKLC